jgi:hypothetical protein
MAREILEVSDRRFSYSAAGMLKTCEKQYAMKYILGVEKDPDSDEDATALRFGKAFHKVCEDTLHDYRNFNMDMLDRACFDNNLDTQAKTKVYACLKSYWALHAASNLICRGLESEIGDDNFVGYVDAVLIDSQGFWWVTDLKTSGMIVDSLFARLHKDPQLNFYGAFAGQLAEKFKLEMSKFAGCRYRVVSKPRAEPKPGESLQSYVSRANVETYDIEIPISLMNFQEAYESMVADREKAAAMTLENAKCNRQNCLIWNRPCPYWSQCHGKTFTECKDSVRVFTTKTMCDRTISAPELVL